MLSERIDRILTSFPGKAAFVPLILSQPIDLIAYSILARPLLDHPITERTLTDSVKHDPTIQLTVSGANQEVSALIRASGHP
jgi:hypothetical protein